MNRIKAQPITTAEGSTSRYDSPTAATFRMRRAGAAVGVLAASAVLFAGGSSLLGNSSQEKKLTQPEVAELTEGLDERTPVVVGDNLVYSHYGEQGDPNLGSVDGVAYDLVAKTKGTDHEVPFEVARREIETFETPGDGIVQDPNDSVIQDNEHMVAVIPLAKVK